MVVLWRFNQFSLQTIMKKIILQGLLIVAGFFALLFCLNQINWMKVFNIEKATAKTEEKVGDLFWDLIQKTEKENNNPFLVHSLDSIVTKICKANDIDRSEIKVHLIENNQINAFALPNGHLVVYTNLITSCENPEELSGVLCHEIAHIELNHVMKKLVKEIGLSTIISMTSGKTGGATAQSAARMLSSTAFDRKLEKEADIKAIDYLAKAKMDAEPFATFLFRISEKQNEAMKYMSWVSTHPDSKDRSEYIIEYSKDRVIQTEPVISAVTFEKMKSTISDPYQENKTEN